MAQGAGSGSGVTSSASPSYKGRFVFDGLGTFSVTVPVPAALVPNTFFVRVKSTIPTLVNGGGASSLVITINQNGSAKYTGQVGAEGAYVNLSVADQDVIAVVFSSASANDTSASVKSMIEMGAGE